MLNDHSLVALVAGIAKMSGITVTTALISCCSLLYTLLILKRSHLKKNFFLNATKLKSWSGHRTGSAGPVQTRFHLQWILLSDFKQFAYVNEYSCNNGPLAHSVERTANNAKVLSSRFIRDISHFLCGLLSLLF